MNISNYLTLVLFEGGASKHVFKRGENLVGELLFFFGDQVDLLAQFFSLEKQKTNALVHTLRSNTIDPFNFPYFFTSIVNKQAAQIELELSYDPSTPTAANLPIFLSKLEELKSEQSLLHKNHE